MPIMVIEPVLRLDQVLLRLRDASLTVHLPAMLIPKEIDMDREKDLKPLIQERDRGHFRVYDSSCVKSHMNIAEFAILPPKTVPECFVMLQRFVSRPKP